MDHIMSIDGSETRATPEERLEALKARNLPIPDNQQPFGDGGLSKIMDRDLYQATKEGNIEKFMDALEKLSQSRELALSLIFDQVTPSGNSLLHVAASSGKEDVMKLILIHFPYLVTRKNSSEDTPLHVAVRTGSLEATRKLIRLRRDAETMYWKNNDSKSPLYLAVENCKSSEWRKREGAGWEILELLSQESAGDEAYAIKIQGMSPVLAALEKGKSGILRAVVDRLPKLLYVRGEDGGTPLHSAASFRNFGAVDLMLRKCPHLALQTDKNGSYPIHIACQEGRSYKTVEQLIEHTWPDLAEIKNIKGQNILHVAAEAGNNFMVRYILEKWGEKLVNSKDGDGNTSLHLASMHSHWGVLRSLTSHKTIDVELLNNDKLNALDVAMEPQSFSSQDPAVRGRKILIKAGVRRSKVRDVRSPREQSSRASEPSRAEWIKDEINTQLLVATLVASVTFTAGFTLPGGYNASSDPHPGMASMLHKGVFQVFVICNTLAMYNSILAVVVFLGGRVSNIRVAERAYKIAGPLLLSAFISMAVAFVAAITVSVSKIIWLMTLVLCIAVLYIGSLLAYYSPLIGSRGEVYR